MPMPDKWVVGWERAPFFVPMGGRNIQPRPEWKAFDNQKEAVNFAVTLEDTKRRTAQLHLPGGDCAYLPSIEQMYARYQKRARGSVRRSRSHRADLHRLSIDAEKRSGIEG
jgi:hypothetical protein